MTVGVAAQAVLEGMPDPRDLRLVEVDGQVLLTVGSRVIAGWAAGDAPMRNLAAVTLRGLGFSGLRVAEVLGLRACWRTDHGSLTSPVPRIRKIMVASGVSRRA